MIEILKEFDVERKKIQKETDFNYLQESIVDIILDKNHPKKAEDFLRFKDGYETNTKQIDKRSFSIDCYFSQIIHFCIK